VPPAILGQTGKLKGAQIRKVKKGPKIVPPLVSPQPQESWGNPQRALRFRRPQSKRPTQHPLREVWTPLNEEVSRPKVAKGINGKEK